MSDLRTRIAAVALQHKRRDYDDGEVNCSCESEQVAYSYKTGYRGCRDDDGYAEHLADVVIRELGMRENFAVADEDGDFVYVGADRESSEKYTVHPGDHLLRRYVTDWKADDE